MQNKLRIYMMFLPIVLSSFILVSCSSMDDGDKTVSIYPSGSNQAEMFSMTTVGTKATTEKSNEIKTKSNASVSQIENNIHTSDRQILMRTEFNSYPPNTVVIKLFLECNDGKEFGFDAHYNIEKKIGDKWSPLPFKNNASFRDIVQYATPVPGKSEVTTVTTIDTRNLQENLSSGLYRVSKIVDNHTVYAEFSVE